MTLLLSLIGLVLVIEGIPYFAFPEKMKQFMVMMVELPVSKMRTMGISSILCGLLIVYIARKLS